MGAPNHRAVVACINWSHPDAPHALAYVLRDGEMVADAYFPTWGEAMDRANEWSRRLAAYASP